MSCMRFMSTLPTQPSRMFRFDSSPGHAIAVALGAGMWDEKSYKSELKETMIDGEEVYEVRMRRNPPPGSSETQPMEKVGVIHYKKPSY
jgi:hypothetical protein